MIGKSATTPAGSFEKGYFKTRGCVTYKAATDSLFDEAQYNEDNLRYISRYVFIASDGRSYTFRNAHRRTYYLYSYNEVNGDKRHLRDDHMSSDLSDVFAIEEQGHANVDTEIDYVIPWE